MNKRNIKKKEVIRRKTNEKKKGKGWSEYIHSRE